MPDPIDPALIGVCRGGRLPFRHRRSPARPKRGRRLPPQGHRRRLGRHIPARARRAHRRQARLGLRLVWLGPMNGGPGIAGTAPAHHQCRRAAITTTPNAVTAPPSVARANHNMLPVATDNPPPAAIEIKIVIKSRFGSEASPTNLSELETESFGSVGVPGSAISPLFSSGSLAPVSVVMLETSPGPASRSACSDCCSVALSSDFSWNSRSILRCRCSDASISFCS